MKRKGIEPYKPLEITTQVPDSEAQTEASVK